MLDNFWRRVSYTERFTLPLVPMQVSFVWATVNIDVGLICPKPKSCSVRRKRGFEPFRGLCAANNCTQGMVLSRYNHFALSALPWCSTESGSMSQHASKARHHEREPKYVQIPCINAARTFSEGMAWKRFTESLRCFGLYHLLCRRVPFAALSSSGTEASSKEMPTRNLISKSRNMRIRYQAPGFLS